MNAPIPTNEIQRLEALKKLNILDTEPELLFDDLTQIASYICKTPTCLISFIDEKRQWFKSHRGFKKREAPREYAFCTYAINSNEVFTVNNARCDARFSKNPFVVNDPNICFYSGAPLITPEGYALGTICVIDYVPRTLRKEQQQLLQSLSRQVMALLDLRLKAIELRESHSSMKRLKGLLQVCGWCGKIHDEKGFWSTVLDYIDDHADVEIVHGICPDCAEKDRQKYEERKLHIKLQDPTIPPI